MPECSDVIVIGSGFGGAVSASRLVEAGIKVKMIERGPWRDSLPVRSMGIKRRSPFPTGWHHLTKLVRTLRNSKLPGGKVTLNKEGFMEMHVGKGLNVICSSNVGGGSHIYSGLNVKPPEPGYWDGVADGLSDAAMDSHYQRVFDRMQSTVPEPKHVRQSIRDRFDGSLDTDQGIDQIGMGLLFADDPDNPKEVVTEDGVTRREATLGEDGNLGSPGGGKATLDFVYLARAIKQGLDVLDQREALTIRPSPADAPGRYRVNVENHHTGEFESHYADNVIVAAGTLNTLHLLLRSRDTNGGLGGMPRLGQRFGGNGDFFAYWNLNDRTQDLTKSNPVRSLLRLQKDDNPLSNRPTPMIAEGALPSPDDLPVPRWLKNKFRRGSFVAGMGPDAQDGTVTLENGKLKIDYQPDNSQIFTDIKDTMDGVSEKTGKKMYYIQRPTTVHPTGGACIGRSDKEGVVGANGEVFGHPGLYVADAAVLPNPVGGPPAMTIAAWADHLAEQFIANHSAAD
jgi:cholesterol oxidase